MYHLDLTVPSQKGAESSQQHHTLLVFAPEPPICLEDVMMDSFTHTTDQPLEET
jgi:hypothetical protein